MYLCLFKALLKRLLNQAQVDVLTFQALLQPVPKPRLNLGALLLERSRKAQLVGHHLFDLAEDMGEKNNLAESKTSVVEELQARMKELDAEITKNARSPWFKN